VRVHRLAIGASIALAIGLAPAVAAVATIRIDDDGKASATSCTATKKAPKTIQAGITAAGKNGKVILCPGTYKGRVRIDGTRDGITIQGAKSFKSRIVPPTAGLELGEPLIWIKNTADAVTLKGLVITTAADDCTVDELVRIQGRGIGILGNRLVSTACYGTGINAYADGGKTVSATIRNNRISNFFKAGIRGADELTTLTITENTVLLNEDNLGPGGFDATGILMNENVNGSVTDNTVGQGTGGRTLPRGIAATYGESLPITGNTISGAETGILLSFVQLMTVTGNTMADGGTGILTEAFTNSTVQGNTVTGHAYGIYSSDNAFNPDGNNEFTNNVVSGSSEMGCTDEVAPGGEDGTDPNTWSGNTADSDSPDGICPPPAS
jgi:nitrous oxidase accessory protein NosD